MPLVSPHKMTSVIKPSSELLTGGRGGWEVPRTDMLFCFQLFNSISIGFCSHTVAPNPNSSRLEAFPTLLKAHEETIRCFSEFVQNAAYPICPSPDFCQSLVSIRLCKSCLCLVMLVFRKNVLLEHRRCDVQINLCCHGVPLNRI